MNPSVRPAGGPRPLVLQRERDRKREREGEREGERGREGEGEREGEESARAREKSKREHAMVGSVRAGRGRVGVISTVHRRWRCNPPLVACSGLSSRGARTRESKEQTFDRMLSSPPRPPGNMLVPERPGGAVRERRRPPQLQIPAPRGPGACSSARGARGAGAEPCWRACSRVPAERAVVSLHTSTRTGRGGQQRSRGGPAGPGRACNARADQPLGRNRCTLSAKSEWALAERRPPRGAGGQCA